MSENIETTVKLFVDDTSLFSVVHDNNTSAEALNRDLQKISEWTHKMPVNLDVSKQAQEVIFIKETSQIIAPRSRF